MHINTNKINFYFANMPVLYKNKHMSCSEQKSKSHFIINFI